jgi:hypothetical protein
MSRGRPIELRCVLADRACACGTCLVPFATFEVGFTLALLRSRPACGATLCVG